MASKKATSAGFRPQYWKDFDQILVRDSTRHTCYKLNFFLLVWKNLDLSTLLILTKRDWIYHLGFPFSDRIFSDSFCYQFFWQVENDSRCVVIIFSWNVFELTRDDCISPGPGCRHLFGGWTSINLSTSTMSRVLYFHQVLPIP